MMDLKEACGSQGSQESSSLPPTSWQAFAHSSTLHGLRFIFSYGQPTARSLLWAVALLACLGLLALESAERLAYFFSYPHVTSVDAVVSGSLIFPVVTICNLNTYRFSRLTRNDLYHAGELLALLDVDLTIPQPHLADPDVLAFLREKANFTANRPKTFCMKEFTERVGHDLKEMMLYCRFQGQECNHSDFKPVLSGTAAQLGRVRTERHRCMTGKPLTSASRSTDCCRFGACEGHDGSPAETNRPQICSPGPGPVIRAAPDRQQSKRELDLAQTPQRRKAVHAAGSVPSRCSRVGGPFPLPPCRRDADEAERALASVPAKLPRLVPMEHIAE